MIIVFIITKLILLFFKFSGDLIAKLPLIKQVNHAGGFIYGYKGVIEAFNTGRGRIVMRGRAEIETEKNREIIVITEIPYLVNKADLIKTIANLVIEKRIDDMRENEISKIKQVRERIYSNMERDLKLLLKEDKNVASVKVEVFENNYKLRGKNRKDADYKNGIYGMDYKLINNAYIKVYVKDKSGVAKDELIKRRA